MATMVLAHQLTSLPSASGVYEFFSAQGKLLYVGKAKSLRQRVRSYFQPGAELSPAKQQMVRRVHHLVTAEVANETEALVLERTLIKQHQPPYNIDLRDDSSWLYVAIDSRDPYPKVELVRRPAHQRRVRLFGPYAAAGSLRQLFALGKKTLGLKTCPNPPNQPCFLASLGRCLGHELGRGSRGRYRQNLKRFEQLLRGEVGPVLAELERDMRAAARARQFERAAKFRDQLKAFARLRERQHVVAASRESFDVFHLARGVHEAALVRLPVRRGVLLEPERYLVAHPGGVSEAEVLEGFLEQYYAEATNQPRLALTPTALVAGRIGGVRLAVPQRGGKRALLELARKAAASHLTQSLASWERRHARASAGLRELNRLLKLPTPPRRIEGYDISNIQGRNAVGSMVVLTDGVVDPSHYRKFRIQGPELPNDVAMLQQVLVRRFAKNQNWPKPDLVVLDGGRGQLTAVERALRQIGVRVPLVALAKREEELYLLDRRQPLRLARDNPGLLMLMELRDEAHRFGITFFRQRHRRAHAASGWDELPGVGPVTKRKLKAAFGTPTALRSASLKELADVAGKSRAQRIMRYVRQLPDTRKA